MKQPPSVLEVLRARWTLWLLISAILVHLLMMGSLFWGYLDSLSFASEFGVKGVDFFSIYEAGYRALANQSVYDFDPARVAVAPYSAPYRYVPFFAYAFGAPANVLPPWWAYWGWVAFNELLLALNAYGTWRVAGKGKWGVIGAAMWFVFFPFYLEFFKGQFSFLMATALFWTGVGILRGREIAAGVPWIVSLVTKTNSALLAPLFLRLGWWRALLGAAVLAGINGVYFIWRPQDFDFFYQKNAGFLTESSRGWAHPWPGDHGGSAFLYTSLTTLSSGLRDTSAVYTTMLTVGVIGLSLGATFLARKHDPLALFAIWLSAFFLFYGFVWEFHYVMLLPALTLLVALRPAARPWALAAFVLLAVPTPYWLLNHVWNTGPIPEGWGLLNLQKVWPTWGVILYHATKAVPVAVFWAYLVVSQLREGIALDWFLRLGATVQGALASRAP